MGQQDDPQDGPHDRAGEQAAPDNTKNQERIVWAISCVGVVGIASEALNAL